MSKKDWLEIIGVIFTDTLILIWSAFTMYYFLLISVDDLPEATRDHQNMVLGGLIGLLGVFTKLMLDKLNDK